MNTNIKTSRSGRVSHAPMARFSDYAARQIDNGRAVALENDAKFPLKRITGNFYGDGQGSGKTGPIHGQQMAAYERAAQIQQLLVTWVLVADDSHAQIYECRKTMKNIPWGEANKHSCADEKSGYELMTVPNGVMEAETVDGYRTEYSRRGAGLSSNRLSLNAHEPCEDIKEELRRRFIGAIAGNLQQAGAKNSFDRLVLMAPARMISELWGQSGNGVRDRIY